MSDSPNEFDEMQKEPTDPETEVISPSEVMHEALKSNMVLESLYAIPPLLLNLCAYGKKDSCSYLAYKGNIIPVVIRRTLGVFALSQHTPPQVAVQRGDTRRIDLLENIKVLRGAFPAPLIKLRQHPFDDAYLQSSVGWARVSMPDAFDLRIDLTKSIQVLHSRMSKEQRNRLRRALNLSDDGIISSTAEALPSCVLDDTSLDGVAKFGSLLGHTLERISSQQDARESEGFILSYVRDYALLRRSFSTLRDCGLVKVFIAYDQRGDPGAGSVLLVSGRFIRSPMALAWLGGSTPDGNRQGLSVAMEWAIITWLIRNGYDRYYMGGIGPEGTKGGPTHFKRGFGGQEVRGQVLWYSPFPFLSELVRGRGIWRWLRQ